MQPCPTCGGMGIDVNGYCTQCRTYRGVPQAPQPPPGGQPYSGGPYSGAPYAGYPTPGPSFPNQNFPSSGPSFPGQVSGPPFPPATYGGGYGAPPTPPQKKNSFMVPALALCGVLLVIIVAIVVVAVVKNGNKTDNVSQNGTPGTATTTAKGEASSAPKSVVDRCVIGSWETTSYSEDVPVEGVGTAKFKQEKNGPVLKFTSDGKLTETYAGTVYGANVSTQGTTVKVQLTVNATVSADVRTNDGGMTFTNMTSTGKGTVTIPATGYSKDDDFTGSDDPTKYTCSGTKLTMSTSTYTAELKKTA